MKILRSYKEDNTIVWYSDCYYNPDDDWSIKSVSYLTIEYIDNTFKVWCTKPLDEVIDREQKFHCICFSPCGNGKYAKNNSNGLMLQDDFIFEAFVAEAIIQKLKAGYFVDTTDVKRNFKHEHFRNIALDRVGKYNIK